MVKVPLPEVGSVPACSVFRYCDVETPWLEVRYYNEAGQHRNHILTECTCMLLTVKNPFMSSLKLVIALPEAGRKEYTFHVSSVILHI